MEVSHNVPDSQTLLSRRGALITSGKIALLSALSRVLQAEDRSADENAASIPASVSPEAHTILTERGLLAQWTALCNEIEIFPFPDSDFEERFPKKLSAGFEFEDFLIPVEARACLRRGHFDVSMIPPICDIPEAKIVDATTDNSSIKVHSVRPYIPFGIRIMDKEGAVVAEAASNRNSIASADLTHAGAKLPLRIQFCSHTDIDVPEKKHIPIGIGPPMREVDV